MKTMKNFNDYKLTENTQNDDIQDDAQNDVQYEPNEELDIENLKHLFDDYEMKSYIVDGLTNMLNSSMNDAFVEELDEIDQSIYKILNLEWCEIPNKVSELKERMNNFLKNYENK